MGELRCIKVSFDRHLAVIKLPLEDALFGSIKNINGYSMQQLTPEGQVNPLRQVLRGVLGSLTQCSTSTDNSSTGVRSS